MNASVLPSTYRRLAAPATMTGRAALAQLAARVDDAAPEDSPGGAQRHAAGVGSGWCGSGSCSGGCAPRHARSGAARSYGGGGLALADRLKHSHRQGYDCAACVAREAGL